MAPRSLRLLRSLLSETFTFLLSFLACLCPFQVPVKLAYFLRKYLAIDILHFHNYLPHPHSPFEGYYTRITTEGGGTVLLIFSTVRRVETRGERPHFVHFSYVPAEGRIDGSVIKEENKEKTIVINAFPPDIIYQGQSANDKQRLLEISASTGGGLWGTPNHFDDSEPKQNRRDTLGTYLVKIDPISGSEKVYYKLLLPENATPKGIDSYIAIDITLEGRQPWNGESGGRRNMPSDGPEGPLSSLVHLFPLHWFVWSVASPAKVRLRKVQERKHEAAGEVIFEGIGIAHVEKNWGWGFPKGWVWLESCTPKFLSNSPDNPYNTKSTNSHSNGNHIPPSPPYICLAGGSILSLKAFLLGFRSSSNQKKQVDWTFRPPFTILLPMLCGLGSFISPFLYESYNCSTGTFNFSIIDWTLAHGWRKLILSAQGPPGASSSRPKANNQVNSTPSTPASEQFRGTLDKTTDFEILKWPMSDYNSKKKEEDSDYRYIHLPCPLSSGHGNYFAKETFKAKILVDAYLWSWKKRGWENVASEEFENSALEWGGDYWGGNSESGFTYFKGWKANMEKDITIGNGEVKTKLL